MESIGAQAGKLIAEMEGAAALDDGARSYLAFHAVRYVLLAETVGRLVADRDPSTLRILDVGPAYQTDLFRRLWPAAHVDSLGLADHRFEPRPGERHFEVDLNAVDASGDGVEDPYDVVVLAEVIEHLSTAAGTVLSFLASAVASGGYLVVQTPNAVALPRRLKMLAGRNPAEPIRAGRTNPGHFHEFTARELVAEAEQVGLVPDSVELGNYFVSDQTWRQRYNRLFGPRLPRNWRDGITAVFRRPNGI